MFDHDGKTIAPPANKLPECISELHGQKQSSKNHTSPFLGRLARVFCPNVHEHIARIERQVSGGYSFSTASDKYPIATRVGGHTLS